MKFAKHARFAAAALATAPLATAQETVKIGDFTCNADRMVGRIEESDRTDAATPFNQSAPSLARRLTQWRHQTDACDHDALIFSHDLTSNS